VPFRKLPWLTGMNFCRDVPAGCVEWLILRMCLAGGHMLFICPDVTEEWLEGTSCL